MPKPLSRVTNSPINGAGEPVIDSYQNASISLSAGTDQVIVNSAADKQIWVYGFQIMTSAAGTVAFQDSDNTAITGAMTFGDTGGVVVSPSGNFAMPIWKVATGLNLEIDAVTANVTGWISYAIVSV